MLSLCSSVRAYGRMAYYFFFCHFIAFECVKKTLIHLVSAEN